MNWYYKLLATRPYLVLIIVAVAAIACIVVSLTFQNLPDFTDPTLVRENTFLLIFVIMIFFFRVLRHVEQTLDNDSQHGKIY